MVFNIEINSIKSLVKDYNAIQLPAPFQGGKYPQSKFQIHNP